MSAIAVAIAIPAAVVSNMNAGDPRYCGTPARDANGRIIRDTDKLLNDFTALHPCPSTGEARRECPGWAIDHVIPLSCGGCDSIGNLQWLPNNIKSAAMTDDVWPKDRWERKIYYMPGITTEASCTVEIIPYKEPSK